MNITEAMDKVKSVGRAKTRIIPADNNNPVNGQQHVQIMEGAWTTVFTAPNRREAESIVAKAVNRVILG